MTTIFGRSEGVREKRACTGMSNKQDLVADFCQLMELGEEAAKAKSQLQSVVRE